MLVHMANYTLSRAVLDTAFKCLSVFAITVAATRLAFLCDPRSQSINYMTITLWLMVEASFALIAAPTSGYRIVFLNILCKLRMQRNSVAQKGEWKLLH